MRSRRARRALAGVAACGIVLSGCTAEPAVDGDPAAQETHAVDVGGTEAADLRLRLERQFGLFTMALVSSVREPGDAGTAAARTAQSAINDIAATVTSAYDRDAAEELTPVLRRYATSLETYAEALRSRNRAPRARAAVLRMPQQMAAAMAAVTGGRMEVDGTAALVQGPTASLTQIVTADAERDDERLYVEQRAAHAAMISVGRAFAAGITEDQPETFRGPRNSGAVELRSALQQLLGEHALLSGVVLRRGLRGARDFEAAAAALNGNTEDFVGALESISGAGVDEVAALWRSRISTLADNAVAVAQEQPRRVARHARALARIDEQLAARLRDVADGSIAEQAVSAPLRTLTRQLLRVTETVASRDHRTAEDATVAAHTASAGLAAAIASGIVESRPSEFPTQ